MTKTLNHWDASLYDQKHSFVSKYGEDLLTLLDAKEGESILDVGCGTGHLASQIAAGGAKVVGIDSSSDMIDEAIKNFPNLKFLVQDARNFDFPEQFDAIFSNATLHWIKEGKEDVVKSVYRHLKPGGRFVAEFGGKGNVGRIVQSTKKCLANKALTEAENSPDMERAADRAALSVLASIRSAMASA